MRTRDCLLMRAAKIARSTAAALAVLVSLGTGSVGAEVLKTPAGELRGVIRNGALEFRGIPYAAPPVGELRWALPRPASPWQGVRDAANFGPACPQQARFNLTERSESEDCLSLNVSAPADRKPGELLPVFFYIHGGQFVGGASSLYRLDKLAREGRMVVVSANYRIGVFGFMSHPAFSNEGYNGNYGLEDQRAALAWVQQNIAAFGGDPSNVTVGGESAGAGSICMHLASPERVQGLFHKAFVLSAGCFAPLKTVAEAEETGIAMARAVGCGLSPDPLSCMRSKSVADWLVVGGHQAERDPTDLLVFGPTVGNRTVPRFPRDAAVPGGRFVDVPVMMGGARNELRLYVGYAVQDGFNVTPSNWVQWLRAVYGNRAEAIATQYLPGDSPPATLGSVFSSYNPKIPINNCLYLRTARALSARLPVYQFEFADPHAPVLGVGIAPPDPGFELGAVHSAALNYFFPNYSNTSRINAPDLPTASQALASTMVAQLASFARTGEPSAPAAPKWPRYSGPASVMLWESSKVGPYDAGAHHRCEFWRGLYPDSL
jgi:para-nitrobenzyl esterase